MIVIEVRPICFFANFILYHIVSKQNNLTIPNVKSLRKAFLDSTTFPEQGKLSLLLLNQSAFSILKQIWQWPYWTEKEDRRSTQMHSWTSGPTNQYSRLNYRQAQSGAK